ncbi:hypothetical protein FACS189473_0550 [Spirochaetia bacterium]|nr:hypothetical protein FACS189473_0550 [Spirochaetia bacterium]
MKRMFLKGAIALPLFTVLLFLGCGGDTPSSEKEITGFTLEGEEGTIDETAHIITVFLPATKTWDKTALVPSITVSDKAAVSPASGAAHGFSGDATYTVTAEDGTTQDYTVKVYVKPAALVPLVNTIWGGATPQDSGNGWVTVTFRADSNVVFAFSSDNTTNLWTVVENTADATKAEYPYILAESNASWMGPFKIDAAAKTLVFNSWMGAPRTLNRLRADNYTVDTNPFTPGALEGTTPDKLVNTVWSGATPQDGGRGWVTVTFKADSKVVFSFSSDDNTTNLWTVVENTTEATKAEYPYILQEDNASWMGPFKIVDAAVDTLVFNSWMGSSRTLQRLR